MSGEEIEQLDRKLGFTEDPDETARDQLRAWQEAQGMTFDDASTPVAPDELADISIEWEV